ncbi:restriction endonuclease [Brevibacillus antibioticus]|uniref:Restriction endonuclease n=1 Tax=Brevibacillus antibioticus TaxID=2570228 RepID=A0A4U2YA90_9BACL|nr:restriction endonuclease [Brevibacillus antibioticus]TKI57194.1 restriction endonuclease [Brevibacillus antibioticus]
MLYIFIFLVLIILTFIILLLKKKVIFSKNVPLDTQDFDPLSIDIHHIDKMEDGSEFEMYLYRLFLALGYSGVYKTVGSRDFGADLVFNDRSGTRTVIQAKRYSENNPIGISAIQEVYSSMRFYKAKKSIVIGTSSFTTSCETLAGINHVKLLDRQDLIEIITSFMEGNISKAKDIIEAEPRIILDSWSEYTDQNREVKKDKKAEKLILK